MFNYSSSFTIQRNIHGISQTPVLIAAPKAAGGFKDVMCSPLQRLSQSHPNPGTQGIGDAHPQTLWPGAIDGGKIMGLERRWFPVWGI